MMNKDIMIDAISAIDEKYVIEYVQYETKLSILKARKKKKSRNLLICAACLALVVCMLAISLPLSFIVLRSEPARELGNQVIENVLFPLDQEAETPDDPNQPTPPKQSLLQLNWIEWKFTENLFNALGAGTDDSVIDQLQASTGNGLVGESMQDLGDFLERLYEYYMKHREEIDAVIGEPESETESEIESETEGGTESGQTGTEFTPGSIVTDDQRVEYQLSDDGKSYTVLGRPMKDGEHYSYYELVIPTQIGGIPVTKIADDAFEFDYLTSIELPEGLVEIGNRALACPYLTSVNLPSSLEIIGAYAFENADLVNVIVPSKVTKIFNGTFYGNQNLRSIEFLGPVTSIGDKAFYLCSSLSAITLPDTVETIGQMAFFSSGLTNITIPQGVTAIAPATFSHCDKLKSVVLADDIIEIKDEAFFCCIALTDINLPDTLQKIGYRSLYGCEKLKYLDLPESLLSIGEGAFMISGIETISIPEGIQKLPDQVFYGMNAHEIHLPDSITSIGTEVFGGRYQACKVYYQGSISQWEAISEHANTYNKVVDSLVIICTDGEIVIK